MIQMNQSNWCSIKKSTKLSTGITIHYVEMGDIALKPLILLHGITDSSRSWSLLAEKLSEFYHLYILDQRGFGDTDKPNMRIYPTGLYSEDIAAFMEALQIEKALFAGHSMGSFITRIFAITYPEKVEKLVLISTAVTMAGSSSGEALWQVVEGFEESPIPMELMDELDATAVPVDEVFHQKVKSEAANLPLYVWKSSFLGLLTDDHSAFLHKIRVPVLIIWGELDELFNFDDQCSIRKLLPDAKFISFKEHGHNVQWENPVMVGKAMAEFFNL